MEWSAIIWAGLSGAVAGAIMAGVEGLLAKTAGERIGRRARHALATAAFLLVFLPLREYPGRYELLARLSPLLPARLAFQLRIEQHGRRMMEVPGVERMLRAAPSKAAALDVMKQLTAKGIARLDDTMLLQRAILFSRMLAVSSEASCAAFARGAPTEDLLMSALQADPAMLDGWFNMTFQAAVAEVEQRPVPQLSDAQVDRALAALRARLPGDQATRVLAALGGPDKLSDRDLCWAARTLYETATAMPDPERALLLRALTQ